MATKRMINVGFVDSDSFLNLPIKSQLLYFHLLVRADDDGFVDKPSAIARTINATKKDLNTLADNGFVFSFSSGVIVVVAWKLHNKIRKDMYKPTVYQDEKSHLKVGDNKIYEYIEDTGLLQDCNEPVTDIAHRTEQTKTEQIKLNKNRLKQPEEGLSVRLSDDSIFYSLTDMDKEHLREECENHKCNIVELIKEIDISIKNRKSQTDIPNPFRYIMQVADNNNWNPAGINRGYITSNSSPELLVKHYKDIEGSLWDNLDSKQQSNMKVQFVDEDIEKLIQDIDTLIKNNPDTEYKGSEATLFMKLAEKLI